MRTICLRMFCISLVFSLLSCTDNERARKWGGTETITLPPNCKFLNASWKNDDLWIVYQDTLTKISYCKEKSSWGIIEGQVIVKEAR